MATYPGFLVAQCILALFVQNALSCCGGCVFPTSGGNFAVSSYSPVYPVGISISSENEYEGYACVQGNLPLLGSAALEGELGSTGVGEVCYTCGDDDIGIDSVRCGYSNSGCCGKCACDKFISLNIHPDCCFNINPMWSVDPCSICLCPSFDFNFDTSPSSCCQCSNAGFNIDNGLGCCKCQDCCLCTSNGFSSNSNCGICNGFKNSNSLALLKRFGWSDCWNLSNLHSSPFARRLHELLHGNDCDCGCNGFGFSGLGSDCCFC